MHTPSLTDPAEMKPPAGTELAETDDHAPHQTASSGRDLVFVSLAALGVVYGDIGTSVLYALRECFHGPHAIPPTPANIYGVLSLIFWALFIVVSLKYLVFVLEADNHGEGGILALTALATPIKRLEPSERWLVVSVGIFGSTLLYGDGIITPAISVLGAVEGLNVATPLLQPYVVPITIAIIVGLFLIQSHGTTVVGRLFGPVMLLWFFSLAALGIWHISGNAAVLTSFNPVYAVDFFRANGWMGFLVLGSVFLVVTGGEALYADMGHFGRRPIRVAWFVLVLPALLLNYFGQGALLLANPAAAENPFYLMTPAWALYPMVVLATLAAVIASQALISGTFSITMQAVQLGFLPRINILHTSSVAFGQIYIPSVNWALMAACIAIVVGFRTSSNLAAAYGIAVTSTMAITTVIFFIVARKRWGWSLARAGTLVALFLAIDLAFLGANALKIPDGGWFPIVVAAVLFTMMTTWKRGSRLVARRLQSQGSLEDALRFLEQKAPVRVPGTAVFLTGTAKGAPLALLANVRHNGVLHEHVILVTVETKQRPRASDGEQTKVEPLRKGLYRVTLSIGFMETPDVPKALRSLTIPGWTFNENELTYFINRTWVIASGLPGMALWRERLFALMSRNATSAADYFSLPPTRVVEIGMRVEV